MPGLTRVALIYSVPKSTPSTALTASTVEEKSQKRQSAVVRVDMPIVDVDFRKAMILKNCRLLKE
jgi:hypothetical protein